MDKISLRKWAKDLRKNLNMDLISKNLTKNLVETDEYKNAKNIMFFYPLKDEVNLLSLLDDNEKNFYLPKIEENEILCCSYKNGDKLQESCFKTLEPLNEPCCAENIDLIIVPALCCDKNNYRLGYGGGFYDRFLQKNKNPKTIVCIPKELIVETIYPEIYDIQINKIISC